jgi:PAS domain S-box-containing protein
MLNAKKSIVNVMRNDKEIELEKYSSLIHILKSQEEFWLNSSGVIISSNLEAVNITGYEEYEVIGKHISFFYLPEESDKAGTDLENAARFGQTFVSGIRVKKRGATFWGKMRITAIDATNPQDPRYKVLLHDATHRAISNLRVRTIKDEYLSIFNNPFVGTFKFRIQDYRIKLCNPKTLEITGSKDDEPIYFNNFFSSIQQFEHFVSSLKKEKLVEGFKFLIRDGQRKNNWAVISARYFESKGFVEGVLFDISEQHTQMMELQRVNTELDNFTYHASHDLRAPIATILGLINLGVKETSVEMIHLYLEMIKGRAHHLDELLNDLKTVSFNNKTELLPETFDFKQELQEMIKGLEETGHNIQVDVDVRQTHDFITDTIRVRTILRNLLINAYKYYNPANKISVIKIKIRVNMNYVAMQLIDNGIGIEWVHKDRIYDMFFRGTTKSTGTGLGLYIVKSMIDKLDGKISFESTLHTGTTFLLSIPNLAMKVKSRDN